MNSIFGSRSSIDAKINVEWVRFWLTLGIASIVALCSAYQAYTSDTLEKEQIELKIQQQKISKTFDSLQAVLKTYHTPKQDTLHR